MLENAVNYLRYVRARTRWGTHSAQIKTSCLREQRSRAAWSYLRGGKRMAAVQRPEYIAGTGNINNKRATRAPRLTSLGRQKPRASRLLQTGNESRRNLLLPRFFVFRCSFCNSSLAFVTLCCACIVLTLRGRDEWCTAEEDVSENVRKEER